MTIGVLLINHQPLGQAMLDVAVKALRVCPLATRVLDVPLDSDPEAIGHTALEMIRDLDTGDGVLVLTDLCGSTPSNIAQKLSSQKVKVVAGLNLSMLMRILNYPNLPLEEMAARAIDGGRQGVVYLPMDGD